ncbi:acetyl/propionyl/methylcrotonyl-CoA carboxylase subunit alpha [Burkholderia multivorans]|uniref:acetyl/propionyl/methylcrotonyl-CoA carboxylase subunit alpha n=1 Tax=Burkholderia multivorans TaxID=87883 RepID=UPI0019D15A5E|nr:biotin carboxylase N-terminal domain-containing protein [Burkholderia multivorans]MBN6731264.1 ATP-grasp domain-containing protein [Burkholderia multivorans]MBN6733466.1 ATP-grasp domain-containing protein [Burkholderia multivorans]MBN7130330.1 ATP-grasp domain-containing protein [Burkholderia multivorans]MBN8165078.1 ATP-grasp domain-containing protein [Burkholderia multivorans]MBN8170867.1 ATP-grasp domain-containing protein [Burkholderia multivorans]
MIRTLLVANRGEIARRIFRTAKRMGIRTVAVYSEPDANAAHVADADIAIPLGGSTSAESYLDIEKIIAAVAASGANAVHPGYGFLSENAAFARRCAEDGIIFVGPSPASIEDMGLKDRAKAIARDAGVPVLPDAVLSGNDEAEWISAAQRVGYPLLVKATAGGGGKGMRLVAEPRALVGAVTGARREAASSFGNSKVFIERYLEKSHHIEIQVFGDAHGGAIHLGERECSVQRRHQKVLEESPSPVVDAALRERMGATAVALVKKLQYVGAGTVEFLVDDASRDFFFLEMNTRLQVEHPVTEAITGLDLVRMQLEVACGKPLPLTQDRIAFSGHAIEIRLYAEDTTRDYLPTPGPLFHYSHPELPGVRYEDGVAAPCEVPAYYDPMLSKVIGYASTRTEAAALLASALERTQIHGTITNRDMLVALLRDPDFLAGSTCTDFLEHHRALLHPRTTTPEVVHLAAALAVTIARRRAADRSTAFAPPGFRVLPGSPPAKTVWESVSGQRRDISYRLGAAGGTTELEIHVDGRRHDMSLRNLSPDGVRVLYQGSECPCGVTRHVDGSIWVNDPTSQSGWRIAPRLPDAETASSGTSPIAPLPGTVVAVLVSEGERVTSGQELVIVEAMKMEHPVTANEDGVVEKIHVSVGQHVAAKTVLLTVGSDKEAS